MYRIKTQLKDEKIIQEIHRQVKKYPRYRYRRIHGELEDQGFTLEPVKEFRDNKHVLTVYQVKKPSNVI